MAASGTHGRPVVAICLAIAVGVLLAAVTNGASDGPVQAHPEGNLTILEGVQAFHFDSLPEMVATSTTVVRGTVVDEARGTVIVDNEVTYTRKLLTIDVERTLAGQSTKSQVAVETAGWQQIDGEAETGLLFAGETPVAKGDRGVFFLYDFEHDGRFGFIADQGVLLMDGSELRDSARSDSLVSSLEKRTAAEVEALIVQADETARQGLVTAQPYPGSGG